MRELEPPAPGLSLLQNCKSAVLSIELRPLIPIAVFALLFYAGVAGVLYRAGYPMCHWPESEFLLLQVLFGTGVFVGPILVLGVLLLTDMVRQLRGARVPTIKSRIPMLCRLVICTWLLLLPYAIVLLAYVNLKPAIPLLNPADFDPHLEHVERTIFGGLLPSEWLVKHSSASMLYFWNCVYHLLSPFLFASLAIALYVDGLRGGSRLVLALCVGHLLDLAITLLYPTRGPIFVHPEWFTGLANMASGELAEFLLITVQSYEQEPGRVYACAGISAMPSYHVFAWTCGFMCWLRLPRWLVIVGCVFVVLNWVSTVVLGWHYALDGLAGIVLVFPVWWFVSRVIPRATPGSDTAQSA